MLLLWFTMVLVRGRKTDINRHCASSYKLNEIFDGSIIRISYRCTKNITKIKDIKKFTTNKKHQLYCYCRIKKECPVKGSCKIETVIYKCITCSNCNPKKVYLGLTEKQLKKGH